MEYKPSQVLTTTYQKALRKTTREFTWYLENHGMKDLPIKKLDRRVVAEYLSHQNTPSNFNHERARLSSILGDILGPQEHPNPCKGIKPKKTKQSLHKPFEDVSAVLKDIRSYNENLFLCCLLTYGCLLRPHREIRQLTWGDFSDELTFISLVLGTETRVGETESFQSP